MTIPSERMRSLEWAEGFLMRLMDSKATPKVPLAIRREARRVLRHYPTATERAVYLRHL